LCAPTAIALSIAIDDIGTGFSILKGYRSSNPCAEARQVLISRIGGEYHMRAIVRSISRSPTASARWSSRGIETEQALIP
jgi:EAL domain-containing protein (putative c-di-GMP-specific phosphodiesterase class I)